MSCVSGGETGGGLLTLTDRVAAPNATAREAIRNYVFNGVLVLGRVGGSNFFVSVFAARARRC